MYRFFQRHGKKLMAVFSAGLMIAFALPTFSGTGGGAGGRLAGKIGKEKIYQQDIYRAHQAWQLLSQLRIDEQGRTVADVLGPAAVAQINRHPVLFLLLQKEAQRMGVGVSNDQLKGLIENTPQFKTGNLDRDEDIQNSLAQLLLVRQAFARAAGAIKISQPMREHELGQLAQSITLTAADFTAGQYTTKVPPPNADQLKAQFEKYADTIKGMPTSANPFGFGYKYPDRVKLQYIAISRPAVRKFVEEFSAPGKPKDPYEWEVEAQKYYRLHQAEFPTTNPAEPVKDSRLSLESTPARPTTKPYAEVRDQVRNRLIDDATSRRLALIQERLNATLAADWVAYHNAAGAATRPTTVPASSLGVAYDSVEYLQKLAAQIQSGYGALPTIQSIADTWLTGEDLTKLPGIGQAVVTGDRPIPGAQYLMGFTAAFLPPENRGESAALQVMQPARPMEDGQSTIYLARIAAAEPANRSATLAEVEKQVSADVVTKSAYDLAKADATKLLDQARTSSLKDATAGKGLLTVGPLTMQGRQSIIGLTVSPQLADAFLGQAFRLIATPTSRPSAKPLELIELQPDGRVLVAELADVQAMWNDRSRPLEEAQIAMMLKGELDNRFSGEWFNYDAVASRLQYVPDASAKDDAPAAPSQPMAPIF